MQDKVDPPDSVTLVGVMLHDVLLVASVTTPAKPFSPVTVVVEVAAVPATAVTEVELVEIAKSRKTKVAATEWFREALVPAIVAV